MGHFDDAMKASDLAYIRRMLEIVREAVDQWGRWPTPEEIRVKLKG